jgi:CspA family cold shock protein
MKFGRIRWFSQMNGYGFILTDDGREYFVHRSALAAYPYFPPRKYDLVSFELKKAARGLQAVNVKLITSK